MEDQPSTTEEVHASSGASEQETRGWGVAARLRRIRDLLEPSRRILSRVLQVLFIAHCVAGPIGILVLALQPPTSIGVGRLDEWVRRLETIDFQWWIVLAAVVGWVVPLLLAVAYTRARHSMLQLQHLRDSVSRVLRDTSIPVTVDINHTVPVDIGHPVKCPVKLDTTLTLEKEVEVSVDIPISLTLPVETVVETNVLGLGTLSIPIKSEIPIDLVYPFRNTVTLKVEDMPLTIEEEAEVLLPAMEVPIQCRLETHLDLMSNLGPLRQFLSDTTDS